MFFGTTVEGTVVRVVDGDTVRIRADGREASIRNLALERYGLIFADPPTFSNSKRMRETFDVERDHIALISAAARLLAPDGVIIFSTNRRHMKLDEPAIAALGLRIEDLTRATIPPDFARNPRVHRCWRLSRV